jgi:hypothetical protein
MADQETPSEKALHGIIAHIPVLGDDSDPTILARFVDDIAQAIYPPEEISDRYGFINTAEMLGFIKTNTEIRRRIKARRALWSSDGSVGERARKLAQHSTLETLPELAQIVLDRSQSSTARLEAAKITARIAGLDGLPPAQKDGGAAPGQPFVLNISFSGAGRSERFSGTTVVPPPVVEGAAVDLDEEPPDDGIDETA